MKKIMYEVLAVSGILMVGKGIYELGKERGRKEVIEFIDLLNEVSKNNVTETKD